MLKIDEKCYSAFLFYSIRLLEHRALLAQPYAAAGAGAALGKDATSGAAIGGAIGAAAGAATDKNDIDLGDPIWK